jgi:hypothetical protein
MVVGEDIPISENVGGPRFMGKSPGLKALQQWIEAKWKPLIGTSPKAHVLPKGWNSFLFRSEDDCAVVILHQN